MRVEPARVDIGLQHSETQWQHERPVSNLVKVQGRLRRRLSDPGHVAGHFDVLQEEETVLIEITSDRKSR